MSESSTSNYSGLTSSVRAVIGAEVLVIDRDKSVRGGVVKLASEARMNATCVEDPSEAWELLRDRYFSVAIVDMDSPRPGAGIDTVTSIQMISPTTSILVLTPRKSYEAAVEAIRAGASDVIHKSPDSVEYLKGTIVSAAAASQKRRELSSVLKGASATHDKFLQLLMAAEREVIDLEDQIAQRDTETIGGGLRILVADPKPELAKALEKLAPEKYEIVHAQTGGEALDRGSSSTGFHFALIAHDLPDLPQSMVSRSLKGQSPELVALHYTGPTQGGVVELVDEGNGAIVVSNFTDAAQLVERLPDLAEAFYAKEKLRRYTQAFREKHYDFVRKFVSLKEKLDEIVL